MILVVDGKGLDQTACAKPIMPTKAHLYMARHFTWYIISLSFSGEQNERKRIYILVILKLKGLSEILQDIP